MLVRGESRKDIEYSKASALTVLTACESLEERVYFLMCYRNIFL